MRVLHALALVAAAACVCADGDDVGAAVHGTLRLPERLLRKGGVRLVVGGKHAGYARPNGQFMLNLEPGSHVVDFAVRDVMMPQIRVDVSRKTKGKYRAIYNDKFREQLKEPLVIEELGKKTYFQKREEIDWLGMLKSPMILMMLFTCGLGILMPMMVDQDQMREQMREIAPQGGSSPVSILQQALKQPEPQPAERRQPRQRPSATRQ
eukprot:TRINITY_DN5594_c0_g2_i3.p1 TRINITY_DN5594_c0_g2~~TRINITY_DN5594_c0_g2_i3.p1  ORF type:complete len:208 (+),score=51.46 TRINITY_DN5594_c0_g2_i3:148-771(+)